MRAASWTRGMTEADMDAMRWIKERALDVGCLEAGTGGELATLRPQLLLALEGIEVAEGLAEAVRACETPSRRVAEALARYDAWRGRVGKEAG